MSEGCRGQSNVQLRQQIMRIHPALIVLCLICGVIEVFLTLTDLGLIEVLRARQRAYEYGGFWPGLLYSWRPNYTGQPVAMFVTYAFLHGGFGHFAVNMFTLVSLGAAVLERVATWGFVLIYSISVLGGAVVYGLLAQTPQPMVGASGALFGLAGALLAWNYRDSRSLRESLWPVFRVAALLVLINVVMYWALNGQLAWQTHLGGFLGGFLAVFLLDGAMDLPEPDA